MKTIPGLGQAYETCGWVKLVEWDLKPHPTNQRENLKIKHVVTDLIQISKRNTPNPTVE